jgi:glutamate/tyrosine decarboxylase-like PLP-dependent enzyme
MTHPFDVAAARAKAYRAGLADRPPRPTVAPAALEALFAGPTPETGEDPAAVIAALADAAEPGLMGMAGPRFFAWVIGGSDEAGVAADWLTSAWGQNAGLYAATPAAAVAEKVAGGWVLDLLDLPRASSVGFVTGATMANFTCLAAARCAVLAKAGWDVEAKGLQGAPKVRILLGAEAHTTVFAALRFLGFGSDGAERVPTDEEGRMDASALARALAEGPPGPTIVVAQAGQVNTGSIDPLTDVAAAARAHGAWLHVDGAFGLWVRAVPELAGLAAGAELADSWATDGHKWLQLPYDSGFAIVRDREAHRRAMTIAASYLPENPAEHDPSHYVPELSRRARGFAAWAVIRALGRQGIAEVVRRHSTLAKGLAARLGAEPGVRVMNQVAINQVIVRFGDSDGLTRAVIARLQAENAVFAGGASWRDRWVLRLSLCSGAIRAPDVDRLADAILAAWRAVRT